MSKDVSITDLIAEARKAKYAITEVTDSKIASHVGGIIESLCLRLQGTSTTLDFDFRYIKQLEAKIAALEAVTVPTEPDKWSFSRRYRAAAADWNLMRNVHGVLKEADRAAFMTGFHRGVNAKDRAKEATQ